MIWFVSWLNKSYLPTLINIHWLLLGMLQSTIADDTLRLWVKANYAYLKIQYSYNWPMKLFTVARSSWKHSRLRQSLLVHQATPLFPVHVVKPSGALTFFWFSLARLQQLLGVSATNLLFSFSATQPHLESNVIHVTQTYYNNGMLSKIQNLSL